MHDDMTPPHALTMCELYAAIEEDASRELADAARIDPIETALDLEYYAGGLPDTDRAIAENLRAYAVELRRRAARAEDARIRDLLLFADQTTQARKGALSAHHVHVDGILAARACSISARDAAAIEGRLLGHMVRALHAAHDAGQIAGRSRFGVR